MKKNSQQWRHIWAVYLFLFIFGLIYTLAAANVLLLNKELSFASMVVFWCLHPLIEFGLAGYAGWKTREAGAGLASCFKVGAICSLVITLGIMIGIYLSPINFEDESWDSFILGIVVWCRLLSFWLPGLAALFGGTIHNKFKNENAASGSDASSTRPF